jgi:plastocyanin
MRRIAITLVVVAMSAAGLAASGVFAAPKATNATNAAITVNVTALDFKFKLSRLSVPKGSVVTFKVINKGNTAHDFDFASGVKGGTPYLAKGKTAKFKVTFRKAGSFRFVCTVPRHVQLGMSGYFKAK